MALTALRLFSQTAIILTLALPVWGAVQLTLSSDQGQVDTAFELLIEVSQFNSVIGAPELGPLQQDFKIHANRSVYLTEKRSGRTVFISRWTLSLSPKRAGALTIPALKVKGEMSQPLSFQAQAKPKPKAEPLILKAQLDSFDAYQGSPIELSVKLYYSLNLQSAELTQPGIEGVNIEQLGEQLSYPDTLDQQHYQVIEQKYLLQALKPGRYRIPALHFKGTDRSGSLLNSQSKPLEFDILPLPNNLSQQIRLVASEVRLEQQWQQPLDNLRAGDAFSRTITLIAHGIPPQWLPDISLPVVEGISVYPQPPQLQHSSSNGVLVSRKTIEFKLLLTQPGRHQLPGISIRWWDSVRNKPEITQLAPMEIEVLPFVAEMPATEVAVAEVTKNRKPSANSAAPTTTETLTAKPSVDASSDTSDNTTAVQWQAWVWAAIALICAVGWSLSQQRSKRLETELSILKRTSTSKPQSAPQTSGADPAHQHNSFSALTEACENNDPELAYRLLFDWAQAHWPGMRVKTLEDIEDLAKDPTLGYLLKNLQHQLQDPSDSWHGDLLIERIRRLRQQSNQSQNRSPQSPQVRSPQPQSSQKQRSQSNNGRSSIQVEVKD